MSIVDYGTPEKLRIYARTRGQTAPSSDELKKAAWEIDRLRAENSRLETENRELRTALRESVMTLGHTDADIRNRVRSKYVGFTF